VERPIPIAPPRTAWNAIFGTEDAGDRANRNDQHNHFERIHANSPKAIIQLSG
jgi:hypothetical protein